MLLTIPAPQVYFLSSSIIVFLELHARYTMWGHQGFILQYNAIYLLFSSFGFSFLSQ